MSTPEHSEHADSIDQQSLKHASGPYFGAYGGRWMPESLMAAMDELNETFEAAKNDPEFVAQVRDLNTNYSGPSASRSSSAAGCASSSSART